MYVGGCWNYVAAVRFHGKPAMGLPGYLGRHAKVVQLNMTPLSQLRRGLPRWPLGEKEFKRTQTFAYLIATFFFFLVEYSPSCPHIHPILQHSQLVSSQQARFSTCYSQWVQAVA